MQEAMNAAIASIPKYLHENMIRQNTESLEDFRLGKFSV